MNCSTPCLPVHHQLPESTQTHVHWVHWCHPTISSSIVPFSSCPQSFPVSGSFQMSQLFPTGSQSIGVSASTSVLPMNIQHWFPLQCTAWDLLAVEGILKIILQHHSSKASILPCSAFFTVQLSQPYMTTGKTVAISTTLFASEQKWSRKSSLFIPDLQRSLKWNSSSRQDGKTRTIFILAWHN